MGDDFADWAAEKGIRPKGFVARFFADKPAVAQRVRKAVEDDYDCQAIRDWLIDKHRFPEDITVRQLRDWVRGTHG